MSDEQLKYVANLMSQTIDLERENEQLKSQLQQKRNIIKEVREYIEEWQRFPHTNGSTHKELKNLIDILDKGE